MSNKIVSKIFGKLSNPGFRICKIFNKQRNTNKNDCKPIFPIQSSNSLMWIHEDNYYDNGYYSIQHTTQLIILISEYYSSSINYLTDHWSVEQSFIDHTTEIPTQIWSLLSHNLHY